jgi:hypothetical protein
MVEDVTLSVRTSVTFSLSKGTRVIRQFWFDELAALPSFLLNLELHSYFWKAASENYKLANVNTIRLPKKKKHQ